MTVDDILKEDVNKLSAELLSGHRVCCEIVFFVKDNIL